MWPMLALLLQVGEVPVEKRTECRLELRREADAEVAAPLLLHHSKLSEVVRGHCAHFGLWSELGFGSR
jgi:hypothetical protein